MGFEVEVGIPPRAGLSCSTARILERHPCIQARVGGASAEDES